jgi:hypothetical protein
LKKLNTLFANQRVRSIFFTHPSLNAQEQSLLANIDSYLKRAGVLSIIDCVDCRPGGRMSIHQFADQIRNYEQNSIIKANFDGDQISYFSPQGNFNKTS